jgi:hypothetical protein
LRTKHGEQTEREFERIHPITLGEVSQCWRVDHPK